MFLFPYLAHVPVYEFVAEYERPHLLLVVNPSCPYCKQVLDYVQRTGMTVPTCNVKENAACRAKLIKDGGLAQVPCLFIDDQPLYDPQAIIDWLAANKQ